MSNKTNFKRIALAVVAALGLGVFASGPSQAVIQVGGTLTVTAVADNVKASTETASATVTVRFISAQGATKDTVTVTAVQTSGPTATGAIASPGGTIGFRTPLATDSSNAVTLETTTANNLTIRGQGTDGNVVSFTGRFDVVRPTTAGTYTYTFYPSYGLLADQPNPAPAIGTFTFTVVGSDRVMTAATSIIAAGTTDAKLETSDSVVVANGLAPAGTVVANIYVRPTNAALETRTQLSPASFSESITAVITGPGILRAAAAHNSTSGTEARSVSIVGDSGYIQVLPDGTGGEATITIYKGTTSTILATEKVAFSGRAATATLVLAKAVTSKQATDSQTIVRLTITDAAGNILPSTSDSWFVHSSDTRVVSNATSTTGCLYSYNTITARATCGITVGDTGTTKIKLANFAFGTAAASLPTTQIVSNELDLRVVGSAASVKLAFDKAVYAKGEEITLNVTARDANGFVIPSQTVANLLRGVDFTPGTDLTDTTVALTDGAAKLTSTASQLTGAFTAVYRGGTGLPTAGQTWDTLTATVFDGAEEAANSALDAAQEATDAAIAATDAAILAQEAADEAASAAVAAQETAQAAVDAVTALSAEVTKLVAQLATLQKLLNRVAKRVGVKL